MCIGAYKAGMPAYNRTVMELKCSFSAIEDASVQAYNRTVMELKLNHTCAVGCLFHSYNRTVMELKFEQLQPQHQAYFL